MNTISKRSARFFVYGTLKRGQCREECWPYKPQHVYPAWTLGRLFDLGEYPALLDGNDRVLGEVWEYCADQADEVLTVLDEIEVTNQPGITNLYDRIVCTVNIVCTANLETASSSDVASSLESRQFHAHAYRFARPISEDQYIAPSETDDKRYVAWPPT